MPPLERCSAANPLYRPLRTFRTLYKRNALLRWSRPGIRAGIGAISECAETATSERVSRFVLVLFGAFRKGPGRPDHSTWVVCGILTNFRSFLEGPSPACARNRMQTTPYNS